MTLPANPEVSERVRGLHGSTTLEEKLAQIVGYWLDQNGVVAPMQGEMVADQQDAGRLAKITAHGLGHFTRVYGTRPVDATDRAAWLWAEQRRLERETRLGIPALVHEECLTGLAAWKAATFPTPLARGASFDPGLVEEMAAAVGDSTRMLGIHQGLAPVLDAVRDPRRGRVDECIAEDPYLVGTIGTADVRGLQGAGVHATLKHFVGCSGSRAGRNHAPVSAGPREIADVYLPPFEMAVVDGGVGSVMNAVARDRGEAAELALTAGIDVELPVGDAYLAPLAEAIRAGRVSEELGLLEPEAFEDEPADRRGPGHPAPPRRRATPRATVTDTGDVTGTDVVQLYGRDVHGSVARPVVQLPGYERVALGESESATVALAVPTQRFGFAGDVHPVSVRDRRMVTAGVTAL